MTKPATAYTAETPAPVQIIADMIDEMVAASPQPKSLAQYASRAGYDPTHFQKLFTKLVGLSPKQFESYLTLHHARDLLTRGETAEKTAEKINLSATGRLYDLFTVHEAVRPGDIAKRGAGLEIKYGWHPTRLGELLVATTPRGICYLGFRVECNRDDPFGRMQSHFPAARFIVDAGYTRPLADAIDARWLDGKRNAAPLPLDIHGSNFQLQVWRALMRIPDGALVSYHDVARAIGRANAPRAVGTAVGSNPISLLIPCHRVIQSSGIIENYGWGTPRKRILIGLEHDVS